MDTSSRGGSIVMHSGAKIYTNHFPAIVAGRLTGSHCCRALRVSLLAIVLALLSPAGFSIELEIKSTLNDVLQDAILVAGAGDQCTYELVALGDIDLSKSNHVFDIDLDPGLRDWWMIGQVKGKIAYVSNTNASGKGLFEELPFSSSNASPAWSPVEIKSTLGGFSTRTTKFSFGVMADTHYYSEPLGLPHPIQQANPAKYDLPGNLYKMEAALDKFNNENVAFATILGDIVEDHKAYPTPNTFIPNGALDTNMGALQNLFDNYNFPIHLVIGNHDHGSGTSRNDLYSSLTYFGQEAYDNNDHGNRMDYTFDIGDVRFIVYDNVSSLPGTNLGFRSASVATQQFLERELARVSTGGIDEGKPVVIMAHARVDCLAANGCPQKVDLNSSVYQWTKSQGGTDEYFLELAGGGSPQLLADKHFNRFVWLNDQGISKGTIGSLGMGQWRYGANPVDGLTFETIYVRLDSALPGGSWDPNNASANQLQYKYVVAGAAENFEEVLAIFSHAKNNGANIIGVLQGHNHINDFNRVDGVDYYSFKSPKVVAEAFAIVDVLYDNSLYVRGFGDQATFNTKKPYKTTYSCAGTGGGVVTGLLKQMVDNHDAHTVVSGTSGELWKFTYFGASDIASVHVDLHSSGTVYESAEDGSNSRWTLFDSLPSGATISNIFDQSRQSRVIKLSGDGWTNGYELWSADLAEWDNSNAFILDWKMKYDETYIVVAKVTTNSGNRYLSYKPEDTHGLGSGTTVNFGLGSSTTDGKWHRYVRDLKADLSLAQPNVKIQSVSSLRVRGSGLIDDVKLHRLPPPADSDGDGVSDEDEIAFYGSHPGLADTDDDGLFDSGELSFWSSRWNIDFDLDGLNNLLDADADGDGFKDGPEIESGSDPADASSIPATVYEDGEGGSTTNWVLFDATPSGATITNIFDAVRQSQVIQLDGAGWSNGYLLGSAGGAEWDNTTQFTAELGINFNEHYIIIYKARTGAGTRFFRYEPLDSHKLKVGNTLYFGVGSHTNSGQWYTLRRDLQADLSLAEPGATLLEVESVLFRGSGRVDDIALTR